jgi:hypothetical protein
LSRMVGEIQRILVYPQQQPPYMADPDEPVTGDVMAAFKHLKRDFNGRLIRDRSNMRVPVPV